MHVIFLNKQNVVPYWLSCVSGRCGPQCTAHLDYEEFYSFSTECAVWWSDTRTVCSCHFTFFVPEFLWGYWAWALPEKKRNDLQLSPPFFFLSPIVDTAGSFRHVFNSDCVLFLFQNIFLLLSLLCKCEIRWSLKEIPSIPQFTAGTLTEKREINISSFEMILLRVCGCFIFCYHTYC